MVWVLYLVLIGLSFYANNQEEKYYLFKDETAKSKYRPLGKFNFLLYNKQNYGLPRIRRGGNLPPAGAQ